MTGCDTCTLLLSLQCAVTAKTAGDVHSHRCRPHVLGSVFPHVCSNRSRNLSTSLILAIVVHEVTVWPKEVHDYCVIHLQENALFLGKKIREPQNTSLEGPSPTLLGSRLVAQSLASCIL